MRKNVAKNNKLSKSLDNILINGNDSRNFKPCTQQDVLYLFFISVIFQNCYNTHDI